MSQITTSKAVLPSAAISEISSANEIVFYAVYNPRLCPVGDKGIIKAAHFLEKNARAALLQGFDLPAYGLKANERGFHSQEMCDAFSSMTRAGISQRAYLQIVSVHDENGEKEVLTTAKDQLARVKTATASMSPIFEGLLERLAQGVGNSRDQVLGLFADNPSAAFFPVLSALRQKDDPLLQTAALKAYEMLGEFRIGLAPWAKRAKSQLAKQA